jgi:Flp pilus assembly protein TadD
MNPGVGTVITNKAVALARLGRYAEAEVVLREALDLDPRDVTAWTNLGLCLSRLRREQEAIACFEKVRQLSGVDTLRDISP